MPYQYDVSIDETTCRAILTQVCLLDWQSSARVVGRATIERRVKYRTTIGDLALEDRLRTLASTGAVEIDDGDLLCGTYKFRLKA